MMTPATSVTELEKALAGTAVPSEVRALKAELVWQLRETDLDRSRSLLVDLDQLIDVPPSMFSLAQQQFLQAYHHFRQGEIVEALPLAHKAEGYFEEVGNVTWLIRTLGLLGILYTELGDQPKAIDYHLSIIKQPEALDNPKRLGMTYQNIGYLYLRDENYERGSHYLERALPLVQRSAPPYGQVIVLCNLSECLLNLGAYAEAADYLDQALAICHAHGPMVIECFPLRLKGLLAEHQGDSETALKQYLAALKIAEADHDTLNRILILKALGHLHLELNQAEQACQVLETALMLSQTSGRDDLSYKIHQYLAEAYKMREDFEWALYHHEQFHALYAAVITQQKEQHIQTLHVLHETETVKREANLLKSQNIKLENEVIERTKALTTSLNQQDKLTHQLAQALTKEAELNQLKSRIITVVSHEFRTPLTIINTSVSLLAKQHDRITDERREQLYKRVQNSVFYITDLIQDVALVDTITKAEKVKPERTRQQFNHMWPHLKQQLLYEAGDPSNIVFVYDSDINAVVRADFDLIKQVALNLLSNALKYSTAAESLIIISAELHGDQTQFSVSDTGIGIPQGEEEKIFDLFYRASNVDLQRGLGLGLYIANQLTQAMGGTLTAESAGLNQGSKFTVTIPTPLV